MVHTDNVKEAFLYNTKDIIVYAAYCYSIFTQILIHFFHFIIFIQIYHRGVINFFKKRKPFCFTVFGRIIISNRGQPCVVIDIYE